MRILFIGDIVGRPGREVVAAELPRLRERLRFSAAPRKTEPQEF
jgi:hypothetical protein